MDDYRRVEHEQVGVWLKDYGFVEVDKGIEDIIQNLCHWGFHTNNSCRDNFGKIWIAFSSFEAIETIYQMALTDHLKNYSEKGFDTLYQFLQDKCEIDLVFDDECIFDPNNENTVISTGRIEHSISVRFDKELLPQFRRLFFELFPVEVREHAEMS